MRIGRRKMNEGVQIIHKGHAYLLWPRRQNIKYDISWRLLGCEMNRFPSVGKGVKIHHLRQPEDSSNGQGVGVTLKTVRVSWKKWVIMDRNFDEEAIFPPGRIYFWTLVGRSMMGSAKLFEEAFKFYECKHNRNS